MQPDVEMRLRELYGHDLSDVDLLLYALYEKDSSTGNQPGPIVKKITENQLLRLRDSDYFWFENYKRNRCVYCRFVV